MYACIILNLPIFFWNPWLCLSVTCLPDCFLGFVTYFISMWVPKHLRPCECLNSILPGFVTNNVSLCVPGCICLTLYLCLLNMAGYVCLLLYQCVPIWSWLFLPDLMPVYACLYQDFCLCLCLAEMARWVFLCLTTLPDCLPGFLTSCVLLWVPGSLWVWLYLCMTKCILLTCFVCLADMPGRYSLLICLAVVLDYFTDSGPCLESCCVWMGDFSSIWLQLLGFCF